MNATVKPVEAPSKPSQFLSACVVEVIDRPGYFRLTQDLIYYSARLKRQIIVPAGYETNFASIPWFMQSIIQVNGKHRKPAVVHDYLCDHGDDPEVNVPQREADFILLEGMKVTDTRKTQQYVMFPLVRLYQVSKDTWEDTLTKLKDML